MNRWATALAELTPTLQRAIARANRISLPRSNDALPHAVYLRRAICRPAQVRATFAGLAAPVQDALADLAARTGRLPRADVLAHGGSLRSAQALLADPRPQTISEQLVLMGWLVPRPAHTDLHAATSFLLPPELRAALPQRLPAPAPRATVWPSALSAADMILACAAGADLSHDSQDGCASRGDYGGSPLPMVRGLLEAMHVVLVAGRRPILGPAAARFVALDPPGRLVQLRDAWFAAPRPDTWLPARTTTRGIDWPLLRRRLWRWGESAPPEASYEQLAAALGPLADAQTHGFRTVDRAPWRAPTAARVWQAARSGPLAWLGCGTMCPLVAPAQYGTPGILHLPHGSTTLVPLAPFLAFVARDAATSTWQVTPLTLVRAERCGRDRADLLRALRVTLGTPPVGWLPEVAPAFALHIGAMIVAAQPALLTRASAQRSVRRYLGPRIAPGVACADPADLPHLRAALERAGYTLQGDMPDLHTYAEPPALRAAPIDDGLTPGACAALLVACAVYRQHAGPDAPYQPAQLPEDLLWARLTPALRAATLRTIAGLTSTDLDANHRQLIATAIRAGACVDIDYTDRDGVADTRRIRPLALEEIGARTYLRADCLARRAKRTFRLDRITAVVLCDAA